MRVWAQARLLTRVEEDHGLHTQILFVLEFQLTEPRRRRQEHVKDFQNPFYALPLIPARVHLGIEGTHSIRGPSRDDTLGVVLHIP